MTRMTPTPGSAECPGGPWQSHYSLAVSSSELSELRRGLLGADPGLHRHQALEHHGLLKLPLLGTVQLAQLCLPGPRLEILF